ncbi:MAG: hypothetical protein Q9P01_00055 [Anaerolineae bacterium]|nr:hypothetical protein [Anaerolineae bacterium]
MTNIRTLSDNDWERAVGNQPAMILMSTGENLRGDFSTQFKKIRRRKRRNSLCTG